MGNIPAVPLIAIMVLVAIWYLTHAITKSTIAAFTITSVALFFIVFYFFSDGPPLIAYCIACGVLANVWFFAWLANECIPVVRRYMKAEEEARLSTQIDRLPKGDE